MHSYGGFRNEAAPAVALRAPAVGPGRAEPAPARTLRARRPWPGAEVVVAAVTLAIFVQSLGTPSPWRDEVVSVEVASRPVSGILALSRHIDLVHLAWYLLLHPLMAVARDYPVARSVSVVAMAGAAVLLVRIGREFGSTPVGTGAGLLLAASPTASRYAQEARPYALTTLCVCLSALALLRALNGRGSWRGYGLAVVLVGLSNVLALLALLAHPVLVRALDRSRLPAWTLAAGGALGVLAPFLLACASQRGQVDWLRRPTGQDLVELAGLGWGPALPAAVLLLLVTVPVRGALRPALLFGLAWAALPPLALWTLSQLHPFWNGRYLVMTVPGAALAVASLLPRRPRAALAALTVPLLILAAAGLPQQRAIRGPVGHAEDVRGTAQALQRYGRPGDAVLFLPAGLRIVALAYPGAGVALDDVGLATGPEASDSLTGTELPPAALAARLAGHDRVWVVTGGAGMPPGDRTRLVQESYRRAGTVWTGSFPVTLYERRRENPPGDSTFTGGAAYRRR